MATTAIDSLPTPAQEAQFEPEEIVGYARSASDALRLLTYAAVALVLLALTRWAQDAVLGFEADLVELLGFLEPPVERVIEGVAQILIAIVGIGVFVVPVVLKRYRLLWYLVVGNLMTGALVGIAVAWLDQNEPKQVANQLAQRAGVHLDGSLSTATMGSLAASFVILAPFVGARWRRAGFVIVALFVAMRIVLSVELPAELFLALAIGAAVGAGVLLAFGRPDQHPTLAAITAGLGAAGLSVASVRPLPVTGRESRGYLATLADGEILHAKVLSPEERSADLLFRMYRYLRLKNVGDERPFVSLRRSVEHEALVALHARDVGVRTPRMRAIAEIGSDSMLLAFDHLDGRSLGTVAGEDVDDTLLHSLWDQVAQLRAHRIAHRDLRRANIVIDLDGAPWLVNFGFSEVAVADPLLHGDVAQLLAALTLMVGAERAVESAIAALGTDAVTSAIPLLQLNALSGPTRSAFRERKGLLKELQATAAERCGVDQLQLVPLARVDARAVLVIVMLVAATYFLLPQLSDLPGIVDQVKEADWIWFGPVLLGSILTYLGATFGMMGSLPARLRLVPTFVAEVATSFTGTLAPASVGGMALNVRYLQRSGVDPAVAVPAVGLNAVTGIAVHMVMMVLFIVWAGRSAFGAIRLPDPHVLLYGLAAVVALALVAFAIPAIRHALRDRLLPIVKRSASGLYAVVRRPTNIALLVGGSALVTAGNVVAMYFATVAFGGELSFAQVGAIYLTGSAIASAAPTPGGIGALEAAVIAGLVAGGMPNDVAVPSVFLFRLATFWLPILPGWGSFTYLRREDYV